MCKYEKLSNNVKRAISKELFSTIPKEIQQTLLTNDNLSSEQIRAISKFPWEKKGSENKICLQKAEEILEKSHLGLSDIKSKVLHYLACQKHIGNSYGTVLLFCGPAGVGKTSIVRSISKAMNRPMIKISLAGMSDADVLKGTSPIYSNSRPGKIVEAIISSQSFSPIILFDEIDKIERNAQRGDPQYALLDILDSNRSEFIDECLEIPLDLRDVIFIATANDLSQISPILLDRLEVVKLSGYNEVEKIEIVEKYVLPDLYDYYKLEESQIGLERPAIEYIVKKFSKEPGVRKIKNILKQIFEEIVYRIEMGIEYEHNISISDINDIFNIETKRFRNKKYYNYIDHGWE